MTLVSAIFNTTKLQIINLKMVTQNLHFKVFLKHFLTKIKLYKNLKKHTLN